VNLVVNHPLHDTLFSLLDGLQPLLDRAEALIRNVAIPDDKNLPWIMPENRPALRLLANCINQADFHRDQEEMERLLRLYLRLNPEDNHGYRALLINYYLRSGQNAQALSLAKSYSDDILPDTLYGHVLASYRLGSLERAAEALAAAVDILPLVPGYLVKKRIARPKLNQHGVSYGGKDSATNVLAFPGDAEHLDYDCLGDLVICAPLVAVEAEAQGKATEAHWAHLVVHGMLHLQGFDHQDAVQTREMEALEIKSLDTLGFANPYND